MRDLVTDLAVLEETIETIETETPAPTETLTPIKTPTAIESGSMDEGTRDKSTNTGLNIIQGDSPDVGLILLPRSLPKPKAHIEPLSRST